MNMREQDPSTVLSVRLSPRIKGDLGRLARATKRSKSFLAAEAVEAYVARELEIVEGVQQGLADMRAGHVVAHEHVVAEMRQVIKDAKTTRAAE